MGILIVLTSIIWSLPLSHLLKAPLLSRQLLSFIYFLDFFWAFLTLKFFLHVFYELGLLPIVQFGVHIFLLPGAATVVIGGH